MLPLFRGQSFDLPLLSKCPVAVDQMVRAIERLESLD